MEPVSTQSESPAPAPTPAPAPAAAGVPLAAWLFCGLLVLIGCTLLAITLRRMLAPPESPKPVALQTYDLAEEARKLVRKDKPAPLSGPLAQILDEGKRVNFETEPHPLLGKPAPGFSLPDVAGNLWTLGDHLKQGPVVVVFYLGYYCNHCVSQLFDLNEDIKRFRELGVEVVAISPDAVELTRERYKQYGKFDFPVLSDPHNRAASAYGVYTPPKDGRAEDLAHGTFVLDQKGIVRWARTGSAPFGHNPTLIFELAKIKGLAR
jgi:peroxiredoxin Q/BCP